MDDGLTDGLLTHGWLFSAVLLAYLGYLYIGKNSEKNSGKYPAFYFSGKVTTLGLGQSTSQLADHQQQGYHVDTRTSVNCFKNRLDATVLSWWCSGSASDW